MLTLQQPAIAKNYSMKDGYRKTGSKQGAMYNNHNKLPGILIIFFYYKKYIFAAL